MNLVTPKAGAKHEFFVQQAGHKLTNAKYILITLKSDPVVNKPKPTSCQYCRRVEQQSETKLLQMF